MQQNLEQYNIAAIYNLVIAAFTSQDLRRLCQMHDALRPVLTDFRENPSLGGMADVLIEYCEKQLLFPVLLSEIRKANPRQYERYRAQLHGMDEVPTPAIPRNLPPPGEFIGRESEKTWLHEALQSRPNLVSINGIGGIGKSALALEVAHECLEARLGKRSPHGIATFHGFIWVTAEEQVLTLDDLLDTTARTLGYPGVAQKPTEEKRFDICNLLQGRPYLLVVDNLEMSTDKRVLDFLDKLPEPSRALLTTREMNLPDRTRMFSLEDLKQREALALMRSEGGRLGLSVVEQADDQMLLNLYQSTSGAPLAIKWAIGQIKQRGLSPSAVVIALRRAKASIFRNIFDTSWELLSIEARHVLTAMPLFATSASRAALKAATNIRGFDLDQALGQLIEMSLLDTTMEPDLTPRYTIHPLTRAHAVAMAHESERMRHAIQDALECTVAYYRQLVTPPEEVEVGDPYWDSMFNPEGAQNLEQDWENVAHLIRWALNPQPEEVAPEFSILAELIDWPSQPARDAIALHLFLPSVHFLNGWGLWGDRLQLSREMCAVANRLGDPCEAWLWIDAIGFILGEQGKQEELEEVLKKGREIARQFERADALILADTFEAWIRLRSGEHDMNRARRELERVLEHVDWASVLESSPVRRIVLSRAVGPIAYTRWVKKDDLEGARNWYKRGLELRRSVGENATQSLLRVAQVSLEIGDIASAKECLDDASTNPRPRDLPSLNYARALYAEQLGQVQEAIHRAELAREQHKRFRHDKRTARYEKLLQRLYQRSDVEPEEGKHPSHDD